MSDQPGSTVHDREIVWEPLRIAVRGHLVPLASQVKKRGQTRGKRSERARRLREQQQWERRKHQDEADLEEGQHRDALHAEQQASWRVLSEEEEREAVRILGPKPWYSLVFDTETVVIDVAIAPDAPDVLRFGQLLRVGYYEVRGINEWEVARRLRGGALVADDRHRLREAGFILPYPHERLMVDGQLVPAYAGYEAVLAADHEIVEEWVASHWHCGGYKDLHIRTKQEFIKAVFYRYAYGYRYIIGACVVGHHLFYDVTRLATDTIDAHGTLIRGVRRGGGWARRGFSLKLCDCPYEECGYHPRIRVVKLGRFKHRYAFEKTTTPTKDGKKRHKRDYLGRFLDTIPFGLALRKCRSADLATMGDVFDAQLRKRDHPDFSGPLNEEFLDYLVRDVQATYWLAVAELDDYARHGLGRAPESIYSSASLAKAYLHAFAFPRASQRDWHLATHDYTAHDIAGFAATTYFGGRAEVHHRAEPVEILHLDFKSEYVAVNDAMGLQDFWLAKDVTVQDATAEIRKWLASRSPRELLAELQRPETWRKLRVLIKLRPDGSLTLPIRAEYRQHQPQRGEPSGVLNIGQQYPRGDPPIWFTLADVLGGMLRDGVVPDIDQALEFVASADQAETRPFDLFGDPAYHVDPKHDNVWTTFIDVRRALKKAAGNARKASEVAEADRLDGQQNALKEIALAGSYGILEELNERIYTGKAIAIDVYALDRTRRYGNVIEEPGPYFAGAIGTFIPAGGRLLLALAEQLLTERGLSYCFMDTDSITPIRPPGMSREAFRRRVQEVVDWFLPLNPYAEGGSLLSYEDQNHPIDPDNSNTVDATALEPLFCIATSAKRYVEFNQWRDAQGQLHIHLRKFTSHGLGQWGRRDQEQYQLAEDMPPPHTFRVVKDEAGTELRIPDSRPLGGPLWVYKLQYDFVRTMISGYYPNGDPFYIDEGGVPWYFPRPDPWLDAPAFYQFAVEAWADYERVRHWPGMRPGNFLTVYPSAKGPLDDVLAVVVGRTQITQQKAQEEQEAREVPAGDDPMAAEEQLDQAIHETLLSRDSKALVSPFAASSAEVAQMKAAGWIRRVKDMSAVPPDGELKTMYQVVLHYFTHREEKAANPLGKGELQRRHIDVIGVDVIGVESNKIAQAGAEDTAEVLGGREQLGSRRYGSTGLPSKSNSNGKGRRRLASLFGEHMPDLLAASCLSRRTLERLAHTAYEPSPETTAAMERAMQLLDPRHPQSIAGWRDLLTPAALAAVLDPWPEDAQHEGWRATAHHREREITAAHRAHLEERERSWMDREAARLERDERAEVVRILRRAGGIRVSTDPATGWPIDRGEWEMLPASVRRRDGRRTMDQALADVMAEMPALGWEVPDVLVECFARARSRELQRQRRRPDRDHDALEDARDRLRGRKAWTEEERARLVRFMQERRARLSQPSRALGDHAADANTLTPTRRM